MFWKKKQFWGSIIAILLLAYCLKDIKVSEVRLLIARLDYFLLILAILSAFLFIVFRALRWKLMVEQQKKLTIVHAVSLYAAGQVLNIAMPMLTGQVGRMFLFSSKSGLRKTFIFSTFVLEILFDAITLIAFLVLISLAFAFPDKYRSLGIIISGVTVALLVLLYVVLHMRDRIDGFGKRRLRARWPGAYITIKKFLMSFTKGIEMLRSSQHVAGSIMLSFLSWLMHTISIFFLLKSFGLHLPMATAATIMIVNTLALMIPITPGNAGTFEVAVSRSLTAFSVGSSDAVLFALALHIIDMLPIFTLGFFFMRVEHVTLSELKKQQRKEERLLDKISVEGEFIEESQKEETV